jgi:ATP-dependent Clp protease, protease subunit
MTAEILIYGDIGETGFLSGEGITARSVRAQLDKVPVGETVLVRINSAGGSASEGIAISNLLAERGADVVVDGIALSAASVIATAGRRVRMKKNSLMMLHDPWTLAIGNSKNMRKSAEVLDTIKGAIVKSYARRSKLSDTEIGALMTEETWFDAAQAVEAGLADQIDDEDALAVSNIARPWILAASTATCKMAPAVLNRVRAAHATALATSGGAVPETLFERGAAEGAKRERARITALLKLADKVPGHTKLIRDAVADGKATEGTVAIQILHVDSAHRETTLQQRRAEAPKPVSTARPPTDAQPSRVDESRLPLEERARLKWDRSPELRAEFGDVWERYLAYVKADEAGAIRE